MPTKSATLTRVRERTQHSARATLRTRSSLRARTVRLLEGTDVAIDGSNPWDIRVHDPRLLARIFVQGSLGFGEAFVDRWWDTEDLSGCLTRLLSRLPPRAFTRAVTTCGSWCLPRMGAVQCTEESAESPRTTLALPR